jgi:putative ABC transport system permease protein
MSYALPQLQDFRIAMRSVRRQPGTAVMAAIVLALGIATAVAVYSAGRALVTRPLAFPAAHRLVRVDVVGPRGAVLTASYADYVVMRAEADHLVDLQALDEASHFVAIDQSTTRMRGSRVTAGFFAALRVDPILGARIDGEIVDAGMPVALLSQPIWQTRFGGDRTIVGRAIEIDGIVHTVIGVMGPDMQFPAGTELWTALGQGPRTQDVAGVRMIGRLRDDVSDEAAASALTALLRSRDDMRAADERGGSVHIRPLSGETSEQGRTALWLLQAAVLALLCLVLTNAGGLMLARAEGRRNEIMIRLALGASRARILTSFHGETLIVALAAGTFGVTIAHAILEGLRNALPLSLTRNLVGWDRLRMDGAAFGFALTLAIVLAALIAIITVVRITPGNLSTQIHEAALATTDTRARRRLSRAILSAQVSLAVILLLLTGLLTRSFMNTLDANPGFAAAGVLTVEWSLPPERYDSVASFHEFQLPLLDRLRSVPGVVAAGIVSNLPMSRTGWIQRYRVAGDDPATDARIASWRPITTDYLSTMGIALLRGRGLNTADVAGAQRVAVVSKALAEREWPDADPLNQQFDVSGQTWTVIGVAENVHNFGVQRPAEPTVYVSQAQMPTAAGFLAVRVAADPSALSSDLRREIRAIEPDVALGELRTLHSIVHEFHADERLLAALHRAGDGIRTHDPQLGRLML